MLLMCVCAWGQGESRFFSSRHSIEISNSFPCSPTMFFPPGNADNPMTVEAEKQGLHLQNRFTFYSTLTYAYHLTKRWELGCRFNGHGYFYTEEDLAKQTSSLKYDHRGYIVSTFARYNWLAKNAVQCYSSAGIGALVEDGSWKVLPWPDLILAGIHFGSKSVYGVAELSAGVAGLGLVAGVGVRF